MAENVDWTKSMQQTYEYYKVDPYTWHDTEQLTNITASSIKWDDDSDTKGSATIDIVGDLGECYVRIYLIALQNGSKFKIPLGTFLVQTPTKKFNGKYDSETLDAYTPLIELTEKYPPIGYALFKDTPIMSAASNLTQEQIRAPVVATESTEILQRDYVSDMNETWMNFLSVLIANAKFKYDLDPLGRILFAPVPDKASMQPIWTYTDDNSSILYPDINLNRDLYGVPNTVEIIYSNGDHYMYAKAVNEDPNSPVSTVQRGRIVTYRETDPDLSGTPSQTILEEYAVKKLRNLLSLEHTVTYSHGYCPVRVGDCVLLNYRKAGFSNVKAVVTSQELECTSGCKVQETAVYSLDIGDKIAVISRSHIDM